MHETSKMLSFIVLNVFIIGIQTCEEYEFRCPEGTGLTSAPNCIRRTWLCDGEWDCLNGTDEHEEFCSTPPDFSGDSDCNGFRCRNQFCVSTHVVCDGLNDCRDFSDEEMCNIERCKEQQFKCPEGNLRTSSYCIRKDKICNGEWDCINGYDERSCSNTTAYEPATPEGGFSRDSDCDGFRCSNQVCVRTNVVCDAVDDCGDFSDEEMCNVYKSCEGTYCLNGGSCFLNNFTRHCSCPMSFHGDRCENTKRLSTNRNYMWIIAFNLCVIGVVIIIFVIFSWRMNRNINELAVRFIKEEDNVNAKCYIDV